MKSHVLSAALIVSLGHGRDGVISMGQSVRQAARKSALETQAKRHRERAEAERRWSALGVDVAVALTERDAAVERLERAAGLALLKLTRDEGLTLTEACEWADNLPTTEAKRLLRLGTLSQRRE